MDVVDRLRVRFTVRDEFSITHPLVNPDGPEAADLIQSLRQDNEKLTKEADDHAEAVSRWRSTAGELEAEVEKLRALLTGARDELAIQMEGRGSRESARITWAEVYAALQPSLRKGSEG